jgi:hypothetical protein
MQRLYMTYSAQNPQGIPSASNMGSGPEHCGHDLLEQNSHKCHSPEHMTMPHARQRAEHFLQCSSSHTLQILTHRWQSSSPQTMHQFLSSPEGFEHALQRPVDMVGVFYQTINKIK